MERSTQSMVGVQRRHPEGIGTTGTTEDVRASIAACFECAETCKACADSCLSEQMVQDLVRCIRINLDCSEVCNVTGDLLLRQTELDEVLHAQIQACLTACQRCEAECSNHAESMEHCRICAESCRNCAQTCKALIS